MTDNLRVDPERVRTPRVPTTSKDTLYCGPRGARRAGCGDRAGTGRFARAVSAAESAAGHREVCQSGLQGALLDYLSRAERQHAGEGGALTAGQCITEAFVIESRKKEFYAPVLLGTRLLLLLLIVGLVTKRALGLGTAGSRSFGYSKSRRGSFSDEGEGADV